MYTAMMYPSRDRFFPLRALSASLVSAIVGPNPVAVFCELALRIADTLTVWLLDRKIGDRKAADNFQRKHRDYPPPQKGIFIIKHNSKALHPDGNRGAIVHEGLAIERDVVRK